MDTLMNLRHVTAGYDSTPVLEDLTFSIPKESLTGIIGPNGAGKSTLLKVMLSLLPPKSGEIEFPFAPGLSRKKRNQKIAYVPQTNAVNPDFPATAFDVALMGRYTHIGWLRRPGKTDRNLAMEALERVGMASFASHPLGELSGGQQQRVFLARALAQQAELYILDEPFKGIDAQTEIDIVALLKQMQKEGKTMIVVHHALRTAADYFDTVILLRKYLIAAGPTEKVFTEENISRTYTRDFSINESENNKEKGPSPLLSREVLDDEL